MTSYQKVKSVAKNVTPKGKRLESTILETMSRVSEIVGATLGPGGQQVLIERQEDLPPFVTKDGVTVYRSLGFADPVAHAIMETARDASIRTASEAGDGTTTATVLSEAIVRHTLNFTRNNPKVSPQRVVRSLQRVFNDSLEPMIRDLAIPVDSSSEQGQKLLKQIASTSANGDGELADAVSQAFDITGDDGNVTIVESSGPSGYDVEKISGYPIQMGYEDSMARFYSRFLNDVANQRVLLDDPVFVLFDGRVTEFQTLFPALQMISEKYVSLGYNHNVVVVAAGFSESVLGHLAINFNEPNTIKIVPMMVPMSPQLNAQRAFLEDVAAVTGARIFDPLNSPMDKCQLEDFGAPMVDESDERGTRIRCRGIRHLEMYRFRSTLIGVPEEEGTEARLVERMEALRQQAAQSGSSELDRMLIQERIARLTGGIARLRCLGASNGELKEKRDRAEDAVCAVRGALKTGALPGGGWTFLYLCAALRAAEDPMGILEQILIPSLEEPLRRLLTNAGYNASECEEALKAVSANAKALYEDPEESLESATIVDVSSGKTVLALQEGVVDALPAVLEALRNSLSIASLLGTLGGTVVFHRDTDLERTEARAAAAFERNANVNPADEKP